MLDLIKFILSQDNVLSTLFVFLLLWVMKKNDEREKRLSQQIEEGYKREENYQKIISGDLQEIKSIMNINDKSEVSKNG